MATRRDQIDALNAVQTEADRDPDVRSPDDFGALDAGFDTLDDESDVDLVEDAGDEAKDADLGDAEDDKELSTDEGDAAPKPKAEPGKEAEAPKPESKEAPEAEPKTEPEVPSPKAEPVVAAPEPTPAPVLTPEQQAEARRNWLNESAARLAPEFELDEETRAEYEENPTAVLPKVAARATALAIEAATVAILGNLPGVIENVIQQRDNNDASEQAFFEAWPELSKPEHRATLMRVGGAYRQQNPSAKPEDFIKEVGTMTSVMLGLPLNLPAGDTALQDPANASPAPSKPPKPSRTAPAATPAKREYDNEFAELSEFDLDL